MGRNKLEQLWWCYMQGLMHKSTQLLRATFAAASQKHHIRETKKLTSIDPDTSLLQNLVNGLQVVHNVLGGIDKEACHHRIPFPYFEKTQKTTSQQEYSDDTCGVRKSRHRPSGSLSLFVADINTVSIHNTTS